MESVQISSWTSSILLEASTTCSHRGHRRGSLPFFVLVFVALLRVLGHGARPLKLCLWCARCRAAHTAATSEIQEKSPMLRAALTPAAHHANQGVLLMWSLKKTTLPNTWGLKRLCSWSTGCLRKGSPQQHEGPASLGLLPALHLCIVLHSSAGRESPPRRQAVGRKAQRVPGFPRLLFCFWYSGLLH